MPNLSDPPLFTTLFDSNKEDGARHSYYRNVVMHTLKKVLPRLFFTQKESVDQTRVHQRDFLQSITPLLTRSDLDRAPGILSFFFLARHRPSSFKFFFEMISRWLAPGRRLNSVLVFAADFRLTYASEELYTICEVMVNVSDMAELEEITRRFPLIQSEIVLGIQSDFYAYRLMEIKGILADDKTAWIQNAIASIVKRFPRSFNAGIFKDMQQALTSFRDEFKNERRGRHLLRIIVVHYLYRTKLKEAIKKHPLKRYVYLKIFRSLIHPSSQPKKVLSIIAGINLIREYESFGEKNMVKAISGIFPFIHPIEHSFFVHKSTAEQALFAYIEVEKKDHSQFSSEELQKLQRELPGHLKNCIENRQHSVFMPRNEEEVMRNILTLTHQIKFVKDTPQVMIIFEEQACSHLYFNVILIRILKPGDPAIAQLFQRRQDACEYIHDRTKQVGMVRKKYPKEASVFRLKIAKEPFLRPDHSIDLYKARQEIVKQLTMAIGEIRDFNGGMISKQYELLGAILKLLPGLKENDELLLENFFYSLSPAVASALVNPHAFKEVFLMLLNGLKGMKSEGLHLELKEDVNHLFLLAIVEKIELKEALQASLATLQINPAEWVQAAIKTHGCHCLGYIFTSKDSNKRTQVQQAFQLFKSLS